MKRSPKLSKGLLVVCVIAVCCVVWTAASASDYEDKDFTLRFPAALSRFATYGDVAGVGGASAGSKWSSSLNPASIAWLDIKGKLQTYVTPQYSRLCFDTGIALNVYAESVDMDMDELGTFLVAAAQINSNRNVMRSGYDYYFRLDLLQFQWAKKFTEDWAWGFAFSYAKSITRNRLGNIPIDKGNSDSYTIRMGTLHRLTDKLLGGVVLDYGWSRDRTFYYAIPAFGMPASHVHDKTRQFIVRPGISFEYKKNSFIYFDYQFGTFWNDTGHLNVYRFFAGVEHGLTEWLYARAGTTFDIRTGSCSWTTGIGLYPTSWFSLDVAYQYDMFPELSEDFGRSHLLNVSLSFTF